MGFFDSFKKKSENPEKKSPNKKTNDSTDEIVDDNIYIRDTETGEISKEEVNTVDEQSTTTSEINKQLEEIEEQNNNNENIAINQENNNENNEEVEQQPDIEENNYQTQEVNNNYVKEKQDNRKFETEKQEDNSSIPENNEENYTKISDNSDSLEKNEESNDISEEKEMKNNHNETLILSILNQKGGVGKSTTAINLAAALGDKGMKVLLVDLDPQGNTSSGLGIEKKGLHNCIYDVLLHDTNLHDVIIKEATKNVDVVPATINLAGAEVELVSEIAREQRLKDALEEYRDKYDYIFVDCPPSLGLLTVNALVAADQLLIPIQCEFYALEGVTKLLDSMKRVKSRLNRNLDIFGVVLTMYDNRTTLSKQVTEEVEKFFGDKVFESRIPRTVKISEAPSFGLPINEYEPLCKGAIMYESLAEEVINRG